MATASTFTPIDHTSDAGFRAWVSEFLWLLRTGDALVQLSNADVGAQINDPANNRVFQIVVTNGGSGYTSPPTVVIGAPGGGGVQAVATATVSGGAVSAITVTTQGSGYATPPSISFTGGGGSGATATAVIYPVVSASLPASINQNSGYAVFRFSDALQAAAPYFFRFAFGTSNIGERPRITVTIGTGVDSSGTIQGAILAETSFTTFDVPISTTTPYPTFACGLPGYFAVAWKVNGSNSGGYGFLSVYRIRDHSGNQTADGLSVVVIPGSTSVDGQKRCFRRDPIASWGPARDVCIVPMGITASVTSGGARQCFRHFSVLPELRPDAEFVTLLTAEAGVAGTQFPARPIGAVDRNYLTLSTALIKTGLVAGAATNSATYTICMLYE